MTSVISNFMHKPAFLALVIAVLTVTGARNSAAQTTRQAPATSQPALSPQVYASFAEDRIRQLKDTLKMEDKFKAAGYDGIDDFDPLMKVVNFAQVAIHTTDDEMPYASPSVAPLLKEWEKAQQDWLAVLLLVQAGTLEPGTAEADARIMKAAVEVARAQLSMGVIAIQDNMNVNQFELETDRQMATRAKGALLQALTDQIALEQEFIAINQSGKISTANPRLAALQGLMLRGGTKVELLREIEICQEIIAKGHQDKISQNAAKSLEYFQQLLPAQEAVWAAQEKFDGLKKQRAALGDRRQAIDWSNP